LDYKEAARNFVENEKQFHLGVIPTEQSNPLTRNLSSAMARDIAEGVRVLLSADGSIPAVAAEAFKGEAFSRLTADIRRVIDQRRVVLFSSVGASGRMAIQLDATWRLFWTSLIQRLPARRADFLAIAECCNSLTTGGDRALVRSVENFEDYMTFGRRQVADAQVGPGDVVVGLAECGLSASINGSVLEADDRGCATYYLYCNPKEILCRHLDRARVVFEREKIITLPLYVGNMAVSGSTRMQVTTVELLVAGAAMELACGGWLRNNLSEDELSVLGNICLAPAEYARQFKSLTAQLSTGEALKGIAEAIALEADTYTRGGLVTYLAHDYLLDILTDTTERQPTFTLPPFRKIADTASLVSWAYAKDPLYPGAVAWQHVFRRPVKGLDWTREDYTGMGASQGIVDNPPQVGSGEVYQYSVGAEDDPSRYSRHPACLTGVDINGSGTAMLTWLKRYAGKFDKAVMLRIGDISGNAIWENEIRIPVALPHTIMELLPHLMVKLVFNLLSTGTMARMGRVWSNWMIQVLPTNKKLIDRSTRIIAQLADIPYAQACEEFYKSYLGREPGTEYRESYVVETLRRLGRAPQNEDQ
jgi:N-acetylmuramic acid 6-phosphate etherase